MDLLPHPLSSTSAHGSPSLHHRHQRPHQDPPSPPSWRSQLHLNETAEADEYNFEDSFDDLTERELEESQLSSSRREQHRHQVQEEGEQQASTHFRDEQPTPSQTQAPSGFKQITRAISKSSDSVNDIGEDEEDQEGEYSTSTAVLLENLNKREFASRSSPSSGFSSGSFDTFGLQSPEEHNSNLKLGDGLSSSSSSSLLKAVYGTVVDKLERCQGPCNSTASGGSKKLDINLYGLTRTKDRVECREEIYRVNNRKCSRESANSGARTNGLGSRNNTRLSSDEVENIYDKLSTIYCDIESYGTRQPGSEKQSERQHQPDDTSWGGVESGDDIDSTVRSTGYKSDNIDISVRSASYKGGNIDHSVRSAGYKGDNKDCADRSAGYKADNIDCADRSSGYKADNIDCAVRSALQYIRYKKKYSSSSHSFDELEEEEAVSSEGAEYSYCHISGTESAIFAGAHDEADSKYSILLTGRNKFVSPNSQDTLPGFEPHKDGVHRKARRDPADRLGGDNCKTSSQEFRSGIPVSPEESRAFEHSVADQHESNDEGENEDVEEADCYEYIETANPDVVTPTVPCPRAHRSSAGHTFLEPPSSSREPLSSVDTKTLPHRSPKEASSNHSTSVFSSHGPRAVASRSSRGNSAGEAVPSSVTILSSGQDCASSKTASTVNFPGSNVDEGWDNECEYWQTYASSAASRVIGRREGRLKKKERERRKTRAGDRDLDAGGPLSNIKESKSESELRGIGSSESAGPARRGASWSRAKEEEARKKDAARGRGGASWGDVDGGKLGFHRHDERRALQASAVRPCSKQKATSDGVATSSGGQCPLTSTPNATSAHKRTHHHNTPSGEAAGIMTKYGAAGVTSCADGGDMVSSLITSTGVSKKSSSGGNSSALGPTKGGQSSTSVASTVSGIAGGGKSSGISSSGAGGGGSSKDILRKPYHHHLHHHHQPSLLKTVSIMDTLSELAGVTTDVRKLSQPGPPVPSPNFKRYTEKVYDAVTSRGETGGGAVGGGQASSQGLSERGRRTPEWIRRIYDIAKKGDLPALKLATVDMEGPLLRNLTDTCGNTLVHVLACLGHVRCLVWLLSALPVTSDALHDENKFGQTPTVCAIKYGRLSVLQWLVENTTVRDRVRCKDGERSLLHLAAKYAQEQMVSWLVGHMTQQEMGLDGRDHHGNTALHLAARTGDSGLCSLLLQHGADLTIKNDLGQKAWEVCVVRGHVACAEYLCVHEAGLSLATDLTRREAELEAANSDNTDLRIGFKEVVSVARRLLKEREEAVRELSRLSERLATAERSLVLAGQALAAGDAAAGSEQQQQQRGANGTTKDGSSLGVAGALRGVAALRERWQAAQKTWFGSSLVDLKHRMLLVEETWKKLRHRSHRTVATAHHPLDVFRAKVLNVRAQGGEGRLGDLPSLCSSEESIPDMLPFSDDESLPLPEGIPHSKVDQSPLSSSSSTPLRKDMDVAVPSLASPRIKDNELLLAARKMETEFIALRKAAEHDVISPPPPPLQRKTEGNPPPPPPLHGATIDSISVNTTRQANLGLSRSNSRRRLVNFSVDAMRGAGHSLMDSSRACDVPQNNNRGGECYDDALSPIVEMSNPPPMHLQRDDILRRDLDFAPSSTSHPPSRYGGLIRRPPAKVCREEMSARLRQLALTSESGSCSVLEVIEPSSDEGEDDLDEVVDEDLLIGDTDALRGSRDEGGESTRPRATQERRIKRVSKSRHDHLGGLNARGNLAGTRIENYEGTTSSDGGGTDGSRETSAAAFMYHNVADIDSSTNQNQQQYTQSKQQTPQTHPSCNSQQQQNQLQSQHQQNNLYQIQQQNQYQSQQQQPFLTHEASAEAVVADASEALHQRHDVTTTADEQEVSLKRKGFLHKFSIKPKWPSNKRKIVKPVMRGKDDRRDEVCNAVPPSGRDSSELIRTDRFNERSVDGVDGFDKLDRVDMLCNLTLPLDTNSLKIDSIRTMTKKDDNRIDKNQKSVTGASSPSDAELQSNPELSTSSSQEYSHNTSLASASEDTNNPTRPPDVAAMSQPPNQVISRQQQQLLTQNSNGSYPVRVPMQISPRVGNQNSSSNNNANKSNVVEDNPPPVPPSRRPPPPPCGGNLDALPPRNTGICNEIYASRLSKEVLLEETDQAEEDNDQHHHGSSEMEMRPESSASKCELLSRPGSSISSFPAFKSDQLPLRSLQKSTLSLTQDMLPATDSSTGGRMSPAPSEVSKTESALSPPSHASDVSKSESTRQLSVGKTGSLSSTASATNCSSYRGSKDGITSIAGEDGLGLIPSLHARETDPDDEENQMLSGRDEAHLNLRLIDSKAKKKKDSSVSGIKTAAIICVTGSGCDSNQGSGGRKTEMETEGESGPRSLRDHTDHHQQHQTPAGSSRAQQQLDHHHHLLQEHQQQPHQQPLMTSKQQQHQQDELERAALANSDHLGGSGANSGAGRKSKVDRPWYELSDEEYDILLPDPWTNVSKLARQASSSGDEGAVC